MESDFDAKNDAANIQKHGILLTEDDGVMDDPLVLTVEDQRAQGEQRFFALGRNIFGELRIVVYTYRSDDVRLITARRPKHKDVRAYEKGN
jgi:uncharacterized protein